jgi:aminopeptidase N
MRHTNRLQFACLPSLLVFGLVLWSGSGLAGQVSNSLQSPSAPARHAVSQLPAGVAPQQYRIHITPDMANLRFAGQVNIELELKKPAKTVTLQAVDLAFERVTVDTIGQAKVSTDTKSQTATFSFDRMLPAGKHTLSLAYQGKINKQAYGLFVLDYETDKGRRQALFTQFEAPDARRMFPSWDEPNFKASFDLSVTIPANQMAISNMPQLTSTPTGNGMQTVHFQTTPRMSTYLLSLNVGDFERKTMQVDGTELGMVTRTGEIAKAEFALEAASQSLAWYNDYFGTPYPLPKLDHIAAPGQSEAFSAMENWGAIFYFEYAALLDPGFSTKDDKQEVFSTVVHETAHQWFGNLVTMAWWDDLWLNEGFASWMAGRAAEKFHPEWDSQLGTVDSRNWVMRKDALATSHSIVQRVNTVQQAKQAFDGITYVKGEAILRMLEDYVGPNAWRNGVRTYLQRHAYGNAVSDDLWRAVESSAGKPIRQIAHDFTTQPGVPLIVLNKSQCIQGQTHLTLTQGEFAPDRPKKSPRHWQVPVSVRLAGTTTQAKVLVGNGKAKVTLPGCGVVLVNDGQSGYFRTVYEPQALQGLVGTFSNLKDIDQLGILRDSWALGLGARTSPTDALNLIDALPLKANPQVWISAIAIAGEVDRLYRGFPNEQAQWRKRAITRLTPLMQSLGWLPQTAESDATGILRNDLIAALGRFGETGVIAESRNRLASESTEPDALPAAIRRTVLGVVAKHADQASWEQMRAQANAEKNELVRQHLFRLLGSADNPLLAKKALELALTAEPGETTSPRIIREVAFQHPDLAWDFVHSHLEAVLNKLPESEHPNFVPEIGVQSVDPAMIDKIQRYAQSHIAADARRTAEESMTAIRERLRIRSTRLPLISKWIGE